TQTPLRAPYSDTACVAFRYAVHEEREQVTGRRWDGTTREIETNASDDYVQCVPEFCVRDPSGVITIVTANASFDLPETVARYEEITGLGASEREIWRQEWALPIGSPVFVHGYLRQIGANPQIGADPYQRGPFLISFRSEPFLRQRLSRRSLLLYALGGVAAGAGIVAIVISLFV
ncbi:MAG: E3 ubiquitin ligase family protein, partial [Chloroflexus sp.]|nr:E3 ubiquitin ligase family protein [Chloroflexus sp.]